MINVDNVQYSIEIEVGGQKVHAVPDTGSFDLVVFSKACGTACGTAARYDSRLSQTYGEGQWVMQQSYGSGSVMSLDATERVSTGPLVSREQYFWDAFDADMPLLQDASFHAIAGIGPPGETQREAVEQAGESEEAILKMDQLGLPVPHQLAQKLDDDKKFAAYMAQKKSLLEGLGVSVFSICLEKESGGPGYIIWNDPAPLTLQSLFTPIEVVGKSTWSVQLQNVRVGGVSLGCTDSCAALLDSGTSLLVTPTSVFESMQASLDMLHPDCSNLDELPDLYFELGGVRHSLPPESYLGTVTGQLPVPLKRFYNHTTNPKLECQLLLMTENTASNFGPMWIMGMPFFRKYYTAFSLGDHGTPPLDHPSQRSVLVAESDGRCQPSAATRLRSKQRLRRVDLSKVRVPRWVLDPASRGSSETAQL